MSSFDPIPYLTPIKGKDYLPVSARLIWFRAERPNWRIHTTPVEINTEQKYAIFHAAILDENGNIMATAHKMEDIKGFGDYMEKAETSAIGRALAMCGFGTQFTGLELDELQSPDAPRIVDGPVNRPVTQTRAIVPDQGQSSSFPAQSPQGPNPMQAARHTYALKARESGHPVTDGEKLDSQKVYALYREQTGKDPREATVEDWNRAAHLLRSWRPGQPATTNRPPQPKDDMGDFNDPFAE